MKRILTIGILALFTTALLAQEKQEATSSDPNLAIFEWTAQSHDFGKIKQNVPVTHEFTFENKGKTPLIITNVQASCGCTTPAWTKDPVPPGGSGFIKATYNAASMGSFNKTVTVTANVETGYVTLSIRGEVTDVIQ
ncbi:MAG: DUF1573 domain-containing protein [Flammeovirgaceae bacterium]|nr:DUF1573 domain-containing protein [Flammeovirgaceae bacterium]